MPTHTRRPAEDLTALLLECHGRIRSLVGLATGLAAAAAPHPADVIETARHIGRGLAAALALHAEDEESSILPRLAGRDRDVDAALVATHRDHARHGPAADRLVALCALLEAEPHRHRELAPALGAAARALADQLAAHLAREEGIVFPAVRRYLAEEAQSQALAELLRRRAAAGAAAEAHSSR